MFSKCQWAHVAESILDCCKPHERIIDEEGSQQLGEPEGEKLTIHIMRPQQTALAAPQCDWATGRSSSSRIRHLCFPSAGAVLYRISQSTICTNNAKDTFACASIYVDAGFATCSRLLHCHVSACNIGCSNGTAAGCNGLPCTSQSYRALRHTYGWQQVGMRCRSYQKVIQQFSSE
jgi:hypothetical protein